MAPKFLENIVILCFERCFSKQSNVFRLKSNILAPPNVWAGYAIGSRWGFFHPDLLFLVDMGV